MLPTAKQHQAATGPGLLSRSGCQWHGPGRLRARTACGGYRDWSRCNLNRRSFPSRQQLEPGPGRDRAGQGVTQQLPGRRSKPDSERCTPPPRSDSETRTVQLRQSHVRRPWAGLPRAPSVAPAVPLQAQWQRGLPLRPVSCTGMPVSGTLLTVTVTSIIRGTRILARGGDALLKTVLI